MRGFQDLRDMGKGESPTTLTEAQTVIANLRLELAAARKKDAWRGEIQEARKAVERCEETNRNLAVVRDELDNLRAQLADRNDRLESIGAVLAVAMSPGWNVDVTRHADIPDRQDFRIQESDETEQLLVTEDSDLLFLVCEHIEKRDGLWRLE
jgi:ribosomal protein L29